MRNLICILICLFVFSACRSGGGDNSEGGFGQPGACNDSFLLGEWETTFNGVTDSLEFMSDCTGTSQICESTFTIPAIDDESGVATIQVHTSNNFNGCLAVGLHDCAYNYEELNSGTYFSYFCGGFGVRLTKK